MARLQSDPTRTLTLRKRFMADVKRRNRQLRKDIYELLVTLDIYGLAPSTTQLQINIEPRQYEFLTEQKKVEHFRSWLQERIDDGILETTADGEPWTNEYIDSSYRKGVVRAYVDTNKGRLLQAAEFGAGSQAQFLESAFAAPETTRKLELLYTRAFNGMKGFSDEVANQTSRILTDGVANGHGPRKIAKQMSDSITGLEKKRALVIARTETIHAHAEGQLDSFQKLGFEEVQGKAEWSTAQDDRVCARCAPLEGKVMSIAEARGSIPLHPSCRCMWIPYFGK